jgi:hypothetical protein
MNKVTTIVIICCFITISLLAVFGIRHYEQAKSLLKDELHNLQTEKARVEKEFAERRAELAENYGKRSDETQSSYQDDVKKIKLEYETKTASLETAHKEELAKMESDYQVKIAELNDEIARLNKVVDDPSMRIPVLVEENKKLVKQIFDSYTKELEKYKTRWAAARKEYNQSRNDPALFVNVSRCRDITANLQKEVEPFKSFVSLYKDFLTEKETVFNALAQDPNNYRKLIDETPTELENTIESMGKENNRLTELNIKIKAPEDWQDTGLVLEQGDMVYILSEGTWSIRFKKYGDCSADGDGADKLPVKYRKPSFDKINTGALIARIRGNAETPITEDGKQGKKFSFKAEARGKLELAINDSDWSDNSGELAVRIVVKKTIE